MEPPHNSAPAAPSASDPIRVVIVDDSAVVRGLIAASLEKDPDIKVVATASNGRIAVDNAVSWDPDVIILDLEMPVMDGMTALPLLLCGRARDEGHRCIGADRTRCRCHAQSAYRRRQRMHGEAASVFAARRGRISPRLADQSQSAWAP